MTGKNYRKGRRKEYKILNRAKALGHLAARTAGSHGFFDVVIIDPNTFKITFVQVKPDSMSANAKAKIVEQYAYLNATFAVEFIVE